MIYNPWFDSRVTPPLCRSAFKGEHFARAFPEICRFTNFQQLLERLFDWRSSRLCPGSIACLQNAAIAACDKNDGVEDGIIDDPRTCTFNAKANVCGQPGAPAACLTPKEAEDELDGILASAPAMYWTRFQTAQMWGQIAMLRYRQRGDCGAKACGR